MLSDEPPNPRRPSHLKPGQRTEITCREDQLIKKAERKLLEFELVEHKVILCLAVVLVAVSCIGVLFNSGFIHGSGLGISALAGLAAVLLRKRSTH